MKRRRRACLGGAVALALGSRLSGVPAYGDERAPRVELALIAEEPCAPPLRQVLREQLAGIASDVVWSCRAQLDPSELPRVPARNFAVRVWIDVSGPAEARLFIEDEKAEHFVERRLPLANGLDEIKREELGQMVRFGVLSILDGRSEAVTPNEVRRALSSWTTAPAKREAVARRTATPAAEAKPAPPVEAKPTPPVVPPPKPAQPWHLAPEFTAGYAMQAYSRSLPVVHELALGAAVTGAARSLFVWAEAGYQWPATYRDPSVSVRLASSSVRIGATLKRRTSPAIAWGLGAAAGASRVAFSADAGTTAVSVDPPGHFLSVTGRLSLSIEFRASAHLLPELRAFCDVATSRIHYDLRDADGSSRRVLAPFGVMPGLALVVAVRP